MGSGEDGANRRVSDMIILQHADSLDLLNDATNETDAVNPAPSCRA